MHLFILYFIIYLFILLYSMYFLPFFRFCSCFLRKTINAMTAGGSSAHLLVSLFCFHLADLLVCVCVCVWEGRGTSLCVCVCVCVCVCEN